MFIGSHIPNWLLQRTEISPGAKLCLARLYQYAGSNGECYPKQETLAQELGVKARQVRNYITELKKYNLLASIRCAKKRSNRYKFPRHEWMEFAPRDDRQDSAGVEDSEWQDSAGINGKEMPVHRKRITEKKIAYHGACKVTKTPTQQMFTIFLKEWNKRNEGSYMFRRGKDSKIAQQLFRQCLKEMPNNPLEFFEEKVGLVFKLCDVKEFGGISYFWNMATPSKPVKEIEFIPVGRESK